MEKVLFVCSFNEDRSTTAEWMFNKMKGFEARSAGTSKSARKRINENDLKWADDIVVMEESHRQNILNSFGDKYAGKISVLGIKDEYKFMSPELQAMIEKKMRILFPKMSRE